MKSRAKLTAAGLAGAAMLFASSVAADEITYRNERFGTQATFPAELFTERLPAPQNGDGLAWRSDNGAEIFIYARPNEGGETPASIIEDRSAEDEVTYSASGSRWAVVTGYREGKIFYERYIFRGDLIHSIALRYPEEVRATYDPIVEPVTESLRVAS